MSTRRFELVLLRHGEAEITDRMGDRQRALTRHGLEQASRVAQAWRALPWKPQLIVCSDARRARETAAVVARDLDGDLRVVEDSNLYLGGLDAIKEVLGAAEMAGYERVVLVGHNPGFSEAASELSAETICLDTAGNIRLVVEAASWNEALQLAGAWERA